MRAMFAGRDPSILADGTVSESWTSEPRRSALMIGASGVRMIGGSGGPFCPQAENAETTINTEIAKNTEKKGIGFLGDLCDLCVTNRLCDLTGYNATGLRS